MSNGRAGVSTLSREETVPFAEVSAESKHHRNVGWDRKTPQKGSVRFRITGSRAAQQSAGV